MTVDFMGGEDLKFESAPQDFRGKLLIYSKYFC